MDIWVLCYTVWKKKLYMYIQTSPGPDIGFFNDNNNNNKG